MVIIIALFPYLFNSFFFWLLNITLRLSENKAKNLPSCLKFDGWHWHIPFVTFTYLQLPFHLLLSFFPFGFLYWNHINLMIFMRFVLNLLSFAYFLPYEMGKGHILSSCFTFQISLHSLFSLILCYHIINVWANYYNILSIIYVFLSWLINFFFNSLTYKQFLSNLFWKIMCYVVKYD